MRAVAEATATAMDQRLERMVVDLLPESAPWCVTEHFETR